jgi:5-methylcytosine-specific restriction endonuclease McrA
VEVRDCTKCGVSKPFSEYAKHKIGKDGLRPRCKTCTSEDNAKYRARTVVERAAYNKQYRLENRDRHLQYNRAWNTANRDRANEALRRYRVRHPERIAIAKALRRKLSATRESAVLALQRVALYGGKCYYCGAVADTIDHRIPICRGGTNLPANLVPACRSCNSRKRHRTESEWRRWSRPRVDSQVCI